MHTFCVILMTAEPLEAIGKSIEPPLIDAVTTASPSPSSNPSSSTVEVKDFSDVSNSPPLNFGAASRKASSELDDLLDRMLELESATSFLPSHCNTPTPFQSAADQPTSASDTTDHLTSSASATVPVVGSFWCSRGFDEPPLVAATDAASTPCTSLTPIFVPLVESYGDAVATAAKFYADHASTTAPSFSSSAVLAVPPTPSFPYYAAGAPSLERGGVVADEDLFDVPTTAILHGAIRSLPNAISGATVGFLRRQRHQRFPFERAVSSPAFYPVVITQKQLHQQIPQHQQPHQHQHQQPHQHQQLDQPQLQQQTQGPLPYNSTYTYNFQPVQPCAANWSDFSCSNLHARQSQSMPSFDYAAAYWAAAHLEPTALDGPGALTYGGGGMGGALSSSSLASSPDDQRSNASQSPALVVGSCSNLSCAIAFSRSNQWNATYHHSELGKSPTGGMSLGLACAVCGDMAQCQHYGVRTCEGCKGFFKRTVQKKARYICLGGKDCVVDKRRRNRCQYCRFQKCLAVGMVREVVRTDSLKGRRGRLPSKSKGDDHGFGGCCGTSPSGTVSISIGHQPTFCPALGTPLTKTLVQAYNESLQTDRQQAQAQAPLRHPQTLHEHQCLHGPREVAPQPALHEAAATSGSCTTDQLAASLNATVLATRQWVDKMPLWSKIDSADRRLLVERGLLGVQCLRIAYRSIGSSDEGQLVFDDSRTIRVESCEQKFVPWLNSLLSLASDLKVLIDQDVTSFCCLSALLLFMHENAAITLNNVEEADMVKNNILNCLKEHCSYSTEAKNRPAQYFATVLSQITKVGAVCSLAKRCLDDCDWGHVGVANFFLVSYVDSNPNPS